MHVCPSLGCRLSELFSRAAMRTPSATRRRRHRRPSGCAFCQTLHRVAPWRPWVRQQVLAAHAFSVSRALSNCSVQPLRLGRRRPGEWLDMSEAEAGHANDLGDELKQFRAWKPLGVTQLMQRCVASTKSRTCCFPGGSDFTTQNGAARNVKGLLHHKCSSQQWPVVPLLFVCCLPAMHSLLCAAAC